MRLARYASRLGFEVEPHTRALAGRGDRRRRARTVSGPRLGAELRLLAREPDPVRGVARPRRSRARPPRSTRRSGSTDEALARRALALLPEGARRDRLALAVASLGVPAAELGALLDSLAFEAEDRDAILAAATRADEVAAALARRARSRRSRPRRAARRPSWSRSPARSAPRPGPRVARCAPPRPARDRRRRPARRGRPRGPGDRARAAGGAGREARRAGLRREQELAAALDAAGRAGSRNGGCDRSEVAGAVLRLGGAHRDRRCPARRALFTTRRGGFSGGPYASLNLGRLTDDRPEAVRRNRARMQEQVGVRPAHIRQVHGTVVRTVTRPDRRVRRAAARRGTSSFPRPTARRRGCAASRRWC